MIDWNKRVQTRGGEKVRVLCIDRPGSMPVVGYLEGCGTIMTWRLDGERGVDWGYPYGLVNAPEKHRYYAVLPTRYRRFTDGFVKPFRPFSDRSCAEAWAKEHGGIVVPVEWEE